MEDREEIVQETFFRLVRSIINYNPDKSSLPTFLAIITKRVCIDKFRKDKTSRNTLYDLKKESANESSSEKGDDKQKMIDRLLLFGEILERKKLFIEIIQKYKQSYALQSFPGLAYRIAYCYDKLELEELRDEWNGKIS